MITPDFSLHYGFNKVRCNNILSLQCQTRCSFTPIHGPLWGSARLYIRSSLEEGVLTVYSHQFVLMVNPESVIAADLTQLSSTPQDSQPLSQKLS